jgi:hypothetical protein
VGNKIVLILRDKGGQDPDNGVRSVAEAISGTGYITSK